MKNVTLSLLFLILFSASKAQKVYFIYLQSENQQPFYARMGGMIFNSSPSGYLILSKLTDSTYNFNIGFQGNQSPDQSFAITVNKKDQGFLLKNFIEGKVELFNLQTMALIKPLLSENGNENKLVTTEKREQNAFTDLLVKAADDSTIKDKPIIVKAEEKKKDVQLTNENKKEEIKLPVKDTMSFKVVDTIKVNVKEKPVIKTGDQSGNELKKEEVKPSVKDTANLKTQDIKKEEVKEKPVIKTEEVKIIPSQDKVENNLVEKSEGEIYKKSTVIRHSESSTTEGFGITFFDTYPDGKSDTIKILIPNESKKLQAAENKLEEKKFLEISSLDTLSKQTDTNNKEPIVISNDNGNADSLKKSIIKKNNCSQVANDDDFFKLRKNMAAENKDDNMIEEARIFFQNKCFTTQQIKNLSTLFLSNEGKYKFLDAAYNYVSDIENYKSLQSELTDDYYINRFKAILH